MSFSIFSLSLFLSLGLSLQTAIAQPPLWRPVAGTEEFAVRSFDSSPANPDSVFAIGSRTYRSLTGGETWDSVSWQYGGAIKVSRTSSTRVFMSAVGISLGGNDIFKSTDGGNTWSRIQIGVGSASYVVEYDPLDPRTLYVGVGAASLRRSTDDGETWDTLSSGGYGLASLAISRLNNQVLYTGHYGGLSKSTDGGQSWSTLSLGFTPQGLCRVVIDPEDIVYASVYSNGTLPGGMFRSTNGGQTWEEINHGLDGDLRRIVCLVMNPSNSSELLIGLYNSFDTPLPRIFRTGNKGNSWFPYSSGIVNTAAVRSIAFDTLGGRIYAGTAGTNSSIYIRDIPTGVDPTPEEVRTFRLHRNYPNPFNHTTRLPLEAMSPGRIQILLYDMLGREVKAITDKFFETGLHEVEMNLAGLASGPYKVRAVGQSGVAEEKIILLK